HKKRKFVPSFRGRHATVLSSPRTSHLMVLFCLLFTKQTVRSFPLENTFKTLEKTCHNSGYALAIVWFERGWWFSHILVSHDFEQNWQTSMVLHGEMFL